MISILCTRSTTNMMEGALLFGESCEPCSIWDNETKDICYIRQLGLH